MKELDAKQEVIRAGHALVKEGLIARTWGNVSCRIDHNSFAITPSGRSYDTLQPIEIVVCKVEDCSYEGEIKPSSEKRLHSLIYQTYPEMNFVIHTHQRYASILSASGLPFFEVAGDVLPGGKVPVAAYGLPGTKKLKKGVEAAIHESQGRAVIMANHGALCYGRDYEEAFRVAIQLEEACKEFLKKSYLKRSKASDYEEQQYYQYYINQVAGKQEHYPGKVSAMLSSRRCTGGFIVEAKSETEYRFEDPMPEEIRIHSLIYQKRDDIHYIQHNFDLGLVAVSCTGLTLKPYLDDFAQIAGRNVHCAKQAIPEAVVKTLSTRAGVLLPQDGAICCAATQSDLQAVCMVMEKNAQTQIGAHMTGNGRVLGILDCILMHMVYQKSYSKRA